MIIVEAYRGGRLIASMPAQDGLEAAGCTRALVRLLGMDVITEWHRELADWDKWFWSLAKREEMG